MSEQTLEEALDQIKDKLDLRTDQDQIDNNDPHRPELRMWAGEDDGAVILSVSIGALVGQQQRFLSLTPSEARQLASKLVAVANAADEAAQ